MTDFKHWLEFLDHYDIEHVISKSSNGVTPVIMFGGIKVYFDQQEDFYDYSNEYEPEWA